MDPVQLVAEVASLVLPKASERGLSVRTHYRFPLPVSIQADALRIRQILINLCSHAARYAAADSIVIELVFDVRTQQLKFYIHDCAAGALPQQQLEIFDPFKQAELLGATLTYEKHSDADSVYILSVPTGDMHQIQMIENDEQLESHRTVIPLASTLSGEGTEFDVIIDQFVRKLPELLADIELAYLAGERKKVFELVHNLKGMGGGFGYPQLTELAVKIESLSADRDYPAIAPIISALNQLVRRIQAARPS